MAFSRMTFSRMTFSKITFSRMTFIKMTFRRMAFSIHSDDCIQHPKWKSAMTFWRMTFKRTTFNIQNERARIRIAEWHSAQGQSAFISMIAFNIQMKERHDILKNDIQQNDIQRNNTLHPKWKGVITYWRMTFSRMTISINSDDFIKLKKWKSALAFWRMTFGRMTFKRNILNIQNERAKLRIEKWYSAERHFHEWIYPKLNYDTTLEKMTFSRMTFNNKNETALRHFEEWHLTEWHFHYRHSTSKNKQRQDIGKNDKQWNYILKNNAKQNDTYQKSNEHPKLNGFQTFWRMTYRIIKSSAMMFRWMTLTWKTFTIHPKWNGAMTFWRKIFE